jgi:hypothetical protein
MSAVSPSSENAFVMSQAILLKTAGFKQEKPGLENPPCET